MVSTPQTRSLSRDVDLRDRRGCHWKSAADDDVLGDVDCDDGQGSPTSAVRRVRSTSPTAPCVAMKYSRTVRPAVVCLMGCSISFFAFWVDTRPRSSATAKRTSGTAATGARVHHVCHGVALE